MRRFRRTRNLLSIGALLSAASCAFVLDFDELQDGDGAGASAGTAGSIATGGASSGGSASGGSAGTAGTGGSAGSSGSPSDAGDGGEVGPCGTVCDDNDPCTYSFCDTEGDAGPTCQHLALPLVPQGVGYVGPADIDTITSAGISQGNSTRFLISAFGTSANSDELVTLDVTPTSSAADISSSVRDWAALQAGHASNGEFSAAAPRSVMGLATKTDNPRQIHAWFAFQKNGGLKQIGRVVFDINGDYVSDLALNFASLWRLPLRTDHPAAWTLGTQPVAAWVDQGGVGYYEGNSVKAGWFHPSVTQKIDRIAPAYAPAEAAIIMEYGQGAGTMDEPTHSLWTKVRSSLVARQMIDRCGPAVTGPKTLSSFSLNFSQNGGSVSFFARSTSSPAGTELGDLYCNASSCTAGTGCDMTPVGSSTGGSNRQFADNLAELGGAQIDASSTPGDFAIAGVLRSSGGTDTLIIGRSVQQSSFLPIAIQSGGTITAPTMSLQGENGVVAWAEESASGAKSLRVERLRVCTQNFTDEDGGT